MTDTTTTDRTDRTPTLPDLPVYPCADGWWENPENYEAGTEHPPPATHWFHQIGNIWCAVRGETEADWFADTDADVAVGAPAPPEPRTYPIDQCPPNGRFRYRTADGGEVTAFVVAPYRDVTTVFVPVNVPGWVRLSLVDEIDDMDGGERHYADVDDFFIEPQEAHQSEIMRRPDGNVMVGYFPSAESADPRVFGDEITDMALLERAAQGVDDEGLPTPDIDHEVGHIWKVNFGHQSGSSVHYVETDELLNQWLRHQRENVKGFKVTALTRMSVRKNEPFAWVEPEPFLEKRGNGR